MLINYEYREVGLHLKTKLNKLEYFFASVLIFPPPSTLIVFTFYIRSNILDVTLFKCEALLRLAFYARAYVHTSVNFTLNFKTVVSYTRPGFSMTVRLHQLYVTITRNLCTFFVHPKFKGVQRIFFWGGQRDKSRPTWPSLRGEARRTKATGDGVQGK